MTLELTGDFIYHLHGFLRVFVPIIVGNCWLWLIFAVTDLFKGQKWPLFTALVLSVVALAAIVLAITLPGGTVYVNIV